jgi:hypothetical protein
MLLALCQRAATVITRQYSCYRLHTSSSQLTPALILEDWQHGLKDQQLPRPVWECLLAIRQAGAESDSQKCHVKVHTVTQLFFGSRS